MPSAPITYATVVWKPIQPANTSSLSLGYSVANRGSTKPVHPAKGAPPSIPCTNTSTCKCGMVVTLAKSRTNCRNWPDTTPVYSGERAALKLGGVGGLAGK
eukprot:TRINITY_DN112268_c0_g1_i1.p4 TRINITY_DN112268_c0_g1~~TRINITY_DN112268_c0_g1_i1.p4  ORF type:complete len:101 (-),score=4.63 TRINITY_DN112268_c0_g1_i1:630-932(-)